MLEYFLIAGCEMHSFARYFLFEWLKKVKKFSSNNKLEY